LMTATLFGVSVTTPGMPPDGAIVEITNPSKLRFFLGKACQLTTKMSNLDFVDASE
ncbi:hypothetical protein PHMEG_0009867, partial [Phytophthora megakarya]